MVNQANYIKAIGMHDMIRELQINNKNHTKEHHRISVLNI